MASIRDLARAVESTTFAVSGSTAITTPARAAASAMIPVWSTISVQASVKWLPGCARHIEYGFRVPELVVTTLVPNPEHVAHSSMKRAIFRSRSSRFGSMILNVPDTAAILTPAFSNARAILATVEAGRRPGIGSTPADSMLSCTTVRPSELITSATCSISGRSTCLLIVPSTGTATG